MTDADDEEEDDDEDFLEVGDGDELEFTDVPTEEMPRDEEDTEEEDESDLEDEEKSQKVIRFDNFFN